MFVATHDLSPSSRASITSRRARPDCGFWNICIVQHVVDGSRSRRTMKASSFAIVSVLVCVGCLVPAVWWLLPQRLSPAPIEPSEVIAVFRSSMPVGAEKKVARGHKLEFVRWLDMGLTNGRSEEHTSEL